MKKQTRIWLVMGAVFLAINAVYLLSITQSHILSAQAIPASEVVARYNQAAKAEEQANLAAEPGKAPISLSPDLSHTDAYEFLDPVPVGRKAPDFSVTTAEGKSLRLSEFKGKKNLVLVFYQGSFCSVCGAQLTNLQNHLSAFKEQDTEIIAISADDKAHALQSVGEHGLTFNVVPDEAKKIIHEYGVANVSKKGIAWPSAFVVDKKGIVQLSYASAEGHRLHSNEFLPVLSKLTGRPAPKGLTYDN